LDFARSSVGTRVNESGIVETIAIDTPRIDYTGSDCGKLLIEPQSTNLVSNSEPTSPGGFSTQVVFQQTDVFNWNGIYYGDNSIRRISFFPTATTAGLGYTFSIFVKMTDGSIPSVGNTATDDFRIWLSNVTTNGLTITEIGSGIYRCSVYLGAGGTNTNLAIEKQTYNSAKTFEVSGFQLESFEIPTSYIPTSGTTATRTKDVSITTGLSGVINSVEGTIFAEMAALANDSTNRYISINDGTSSNEIIFKFGTSSNQIQMRSIGTATSFIMSYSGATVTNMNKIALKYKANDCSLWVNGALVAIDTTFTAYAASALTNISFSNSGGTGQWLEAIVKQLAVFPTALSDADLTTLTTL
jgi:hypothetical protein